MREAHTPVKYLDFWLIPAACLVAAAAVLISGGNQAIFLILNKDLGILPGAFWANLTLLGNGLVALALLAPFAHRRPELLWTALLAGLLTVLLVQGIKHGLHWPRPLGVLPAGSFNVTGQPLRANAFPSGHSATAAVLAGVLWLHLRSPLARGSVLGLACLVGLSRVAVGAHWPLDVLAGFAMGWTCAAAALVWRRYWTWGVRGRGASLIALLFSLLPLLLFLPWSSGYPQSDPLRYLIAAAGCLLAVNDYALRHRNRTRATPPRA